MLLDPVDELDIQLSALRLGHFALASEVASSAWIVDSGASHHMYNGDKHGYITYNRLPSPIDIKLGDDTNVRTTHQGIISIQNHRLNALHTPSFRYSLLSVGDLDTHGYITEFGNGKCAILDLQRNVAMTGRKNGKLY